MTNQDLFRSFFSVSNKEISIYVKNINSDEIVFFKKEKIDNNHSHFYNDRLQNFFVEKIDEIEEQIKLFVDNISLIIESENIVSIRFSLKQKIENKVISLKELKSLLLVGQEEILKYNKNLLLIHFLVDLINIDGKIVDTIENQFVKKFVCVDLRFICINQNTVDGFKNLFKKKQIFLEKMFSAEYLKEFMTNNENIINSIDKIESGINKLEVNLVPKKSNKKGFFETFFDYFS
jgi:hypothetical protein